MSAPISTGQELKAAAFDLLEVTREEIILKARRRFGDALLRNGEATTDDAREGLEIPEGVDPVCLGAVPGFLARQGIIRRVGYRPSLRPEAHARPLSIWGLLDASKLLAWLAAHPEREARPSAQGELPLYETPGRGNAPANS